MMYIILLLDAVSVILSFIVINFLYKTYIELKERATMETSDFEQSGTIDSVEEIVYAKPPEEESVDIEEDEIFEEISSAENEEIVDEVFEDVSGEENEEFIEELTEPTITITNNQEDALVHSTFYNVEALEVSVVPEMSRRRRLALKLTQMNNDD